MATTYQEILSSMYGTYQELTGHSPDDASDIGIRFKILASQLAFLRGELAEMSHQVFPTTAQGSFLDLHSNTRGIQRKPAVAASGLLRFSRTATTTGEVLIPAGRICQAVGDEALRVQTTTDVIVPPTALFVDCPAVAIQLGSGGNFKPGLITVMVTPALGMSAVQNPAAFTGGVDAEDDAALRARLEQSYHAISTGANAAYYMDAALQFDGVASAAVLPLRRGAGTVDVIVSSLGANPSPALLAQIQAQLDRVREIGISTLVLAATEVAVDISLEIQPHKGADFTAVVALCKAAITQYLRSLAVGQPLLIAALGRVILGVQGVYNYKLTAPTADRHILPEQIVRAGQVTIARMAVTD